MRTGLIVSAAIAVAACGAPKDTPALRPAADSTTATSQSVAPTAGNVLIVGTSLTAGYGLDDPADAYPAVLQRIADSLHYDVVIQNAGLSGETSAGALRRIDWLLRTPYDVVIVETGANDGLRGLDVDSSRANLLEIVKRIGAKLPAAKIAIVQMEAPPNLGPRYTQAFHNLFGEAAKASGADLFPFLLDGVAGTQQFNQRDGIHPNEAGARIVAATVWRSLEPLIRKFSPKSRP